MIESKFSNGFIVHTFEELENHKILKKSKIITQKIKSEK